MEQKKTLPSIRISKTYKVAIFSLVEEGFIESGHLMTPFCRTLAIAYIPYNTTLKFKVDSNVILNMFITKTMFGNPLEYADIQKYDPFILSNIDLKKKLTISVNCIEKVIDINDNNGLEPIRFQ